MITSFPIAGLITLALFLAASAIMRTRINRWLRLLFAAPFFLAGLGLFGGIGVKTASYLTTPSQAAVVSELRECSQPNDRASIVEKLLQRGFAPILTEAPFQDPRSLSGISPTLTASATSYISLEEIPIRPSDRDRVPNALKAVFLFDSQQRLITWSYVIASPSL